MSDSPFVQFYPSDWLAGTRGLSAQETGVYITLVAMIYEREAPIPFDERRLSRLCGCSASAFKKALAALEEDGKITRRDGGLWNNRAQKEIKKRAEKRNKAAESARARWEKTQEKQHHGDANALQTQSERNANQKPEPDMKEETPNGVSKKKRGSRLSEDWSLPKDWGDWALSQQWPESVIREQAEKFRDYWISVPGQKGVKLDWLATWRNWMRNSNAPKLHTGGQYGKRPSRSEDHLNAFIAGARGTS